MNIRNVRKQSVLKTPVLSTAAAAAAKSLQSCLTLCDPRDGSPPGSPILGILQARTLEWVAIAFSNSWKFKVKVKPLSRIRLLATTRTAAYQAPPSMGFSRQEYWSGMLLPSPVNRLRISKYNSNKIDKIARRNIKNMNSQSKNKTHGQRRQSAASDTFKCLAHWKV